MNDHPSSPAKPPATGGAAAGDLARLRARHPAWYIRHASTDNPGELGYVADRDGCLITAPSLARLSDRLADADSPSPPPIPDAGGWISGPMLSHLGGPETAAPAVRAIVQTVARLGMELPEWTVVQIPAGWRATRNTPGGVELRIVKAALPALEAAMTTAELALTRDAHPGWSIRPAEHGGGYLAQHGDPPALFGRTLTELTAAITEHGQPPGSRGPASADTASYRPINGSGH